MTESKQLSFSEHLAAAEKSKETFLKSNVFTPEAKRILDNNTRATVVVMVETKEKNGEKNLSGLLTALESAKQNEKVIYKPNHMYSTVEVDAPSNVVAILPKLRPEITEIYIPEENSSNKTKKIMPMGI